MYKTALQEKNSVMTLSKAVDCDADPVILFKKLKDKTHTNRSLQNKILLESCEIDSKRKLKSILMNRAALRIECLDQQVTIAALTNNGVNALSILSEIFNVEIASTDNKKPFIIVTYVSFTENTKENVDEDTRLKQSNPIDCLRKIQSAFKSQSNHEFAIFICGLFSFDFIASFEELPNVPFGKNDCADYVFYLAEELIIFDHQSRRANICGNIFSGESSENNYYEQSRKIEKISNEISKLGRIHNSSKIKASKSEKAEIDCDISDSEYQETVKDLKNEIAAGNIFQVVPSRTFTIPCADTLLSYQRLKETNPSPYMFYMQDEKFTLFGASPESALKYKKSNNKVELYPIAGTRPRGKYSNGDIDHDLDKRLEAELKQDQKEIAEHMMLVDLARNDISRISNIGSQKIPRLLEIDRYSQVMHLVSCVQGELKPDLDCFHAYQACMNMGTLTGAPKIKATELIRKVENKRRGSYGGAVGYINTHGDMDSCIVIRSAFCKEGNAHIQAGAGIVFDSEPHLEAQETRAKANAVIFAIQQANESAVQNAGQANE